METPEPSTQTGQSKKDAVLFVDDEENILKAVHRLLRNENYRLLFTTDPEKAIEILQTEDVAVIVSDQKMPGMTGTELLAKAKTIDPDIIRIILTGYADIKAAVEAINKGEVFRFISKPWDDEELKTIIRQAIFHHFLIVENKRLLRVTQEQNQRLEELNADLEKRVDERTSQLLEKHQELARLYQKLQSNFKDTVRVFIDLIELYDPFLGGHSKRVGMLAKELAEKMNIMGADLDLIEMAASLHDIGLMGVPKEFWHWKPSGFSPAQEAVFKTHPEIGYRLLYKIEFLRQAAVIVMCHHERFDGMGFPSGLPSVSIPLGARIINVVSTYDNYLHQQDLDKENALKRLRKLAGSALDPEIVRVFEDIIKSIPPVRGEKQINIDDLKAGMQLSSDIVTASGRMLMAKDSVLTNTHIIRLKNIHEMDPIIDKIYIYHLY
ncbi:MAG: HD domain-containing phosphohydrolase [Dissulfurimicrobium hydrothermale]|uniref:HD domain-containing phosphohydrolase n=1 Tax=Dissulfurimicrobium hydrothermale TaxID=1750598 RepID=UPI003C7352E3